MSSDYTVDVKESRKQGYHLIVTSGDERILIHNRYDPVKEASGWAEEIAGRYDKVLLVGGGLGYLPEALEKEGVTCSIVECLPSGFEPEDTPIQRYREQGDVVDFEPSADPVTIIHQLRADRVSGSKALLHPGYDHLIPEPESFLESLHLMSRGKLRNVQSRFKFFNRQFENFLSILPSMESIYPIESLRGEFDDRPAVLVGAGPSLGDAFQWLREYQDRLVIVAVDSAFSSLMKSGIIPDFTVTMDPQELNADYIQGTFEGTMVSSLTATPEYVDWGKDGTVFGFFPSHDPAGKRLTSSLLRWAKQFISGDSYLQSGGSVTSTAIDCLRRMGNDPICITGVDHAFTHYRAVAPGNFREEMFIRSLNRFSSLPGKHLDFIFESVETSGKQLKQVESREGATIYTMDEYEVQNNWFEQAADVLDVECLDMRSDGLKMRGWSVVTSPSAYISEQQWETLPEFQCEDREPFEVDWSAMDQSVEEVMDQIPGDPGDFKEILRSNRVPGNQFWTYFANPLVEYISMQEPDNFDRVVEGYYGKLKENLHRLRRVVNKQRN